MSNNSFCIIGVGRHARKKLIPSIKLIKNYKLVTVTRNINNIIDGVKNYNDVKSALKYLDHNFIFIISTPPFTHYKILKILLSYRVKVFVEKPIVVRSTQLNKIIKLSKFSNSLFYEIFPYKLSKIYKYLLNDYKKNENSIKNININFLIPSIPVDSFRKLNRIIDSSLYDIGCYPISLLVDMGFKFKKCKLKIFYPKDIFKELMVIEFFEKNIKITIKFGIDKFYQNNVSFLTYNNYKYSYNNFFYAFPKNKSIDIFKNDILHKNKLIKDNNLFTELFTKNSAFFKLNQKTIFNNMLNTVKILENLSLKTKNKR